MRAPRKAGLSQKGKLPMPKWLEKISQFLQEENGPTAVEYAVMLALIVVACLVAITALGTAANQTFGNVALQTATSGS